MTNYQLLIQTHLNAVGEATENYYWATHPDEVEV